MGATAFQKGLGAMHSLSHPCSAHLNTHHGLTNAVVMPYVLAWNRNALEAKMSRLAAFLGVELQPGHLTPLHRRGDRLPSILADGRDVLRMVVGQGMRLAALGVALGLVGAAMAGKAAQSLLINVSPFDPVSFAGVATFLMLVALLASAIPARRATKVDPIIALRAD